MFIEDWKLTEDSKEEDREKAERAVNLYKHAKNLIEEVTKDKVRFHDIEFFLSGEGRFSYIDTRFVSESPTKSEIERVIMLEKYKLSIVSSSRKMSPLQVVPLSPYYIDIKLKGMSHFMTVTESDTVDSFRANLKVLGSKIKKQNEFYLMESIMGGYLTINETGKEKSF